ncbi:hypothetical protein IGI53_001472 [Enterococcus sp. DIV0788_1]
MGEYGQFHINFSQQSRKHRVSGAFRFSTCVGDETK